METLSQITTDILRHNDTALSTLRSLTAPGRIALPPADSLGRPVPHAAGVPVAVQLHYLVGNHDWFLHLPDPNYNTLRQAVVRHLGLANDPQQPFPHDPAESPRLHEMLRRHRVLARHGDTFDPLSFAGRRDASSLGDALVIDLLNRFPASVEADMGADLPMATLVGLRELDNLRPILLAPQWIDSLLERTCPRASQRQRIKQLWDQQAEEFLSLPFVRSGAVWNANELIDGLAGALKFSQRSSAGWAAKTIRWLETLRGQGGESYYPHALAEPDFRNRRAKFVVYGHTHLAETVPLDASYAESYVLNQMYFNAGTWRRVLRPTVSSVDAREFIPIEAMTYLAFFQADERQGRPYETWSGTLGLKPAEVPALRIDAGQDTVAPTPHFAAAHVSASVVPPPAPHFAGVSTGPVRPTRRQR